MSWHRSIGRWAGKTGSNREFVRGFVESAEPRQLARALSENPAFVTELIKALDVKAISGVVNENTDFLGEMVEHLDPKALAEVVNSNARIIPRFVECIDPNVFATSVAPVLSNIKRATLRPPTLEISKIPRTKIQRRKKTDKI
ncbi:MAG: hypothetical protein PHO53_00740 [Actinomycetota bacterium]|nr:hypothetical protein [Actinomycetota bacterium]